MVGAGSGGRGHSVRPEGRNEEHGPALGATGTLGSPLAPPHTPYTLKRCVLEQTILSECMYFLAGFLTENREGGRAGGRPCLEQVSPPLPPATPPEEETSCRLRCKPRGLSPRLAGSPGPGCGEAGAAPGAYLPFRNIIPGKFLLWEGEEEGGWGTGRG